MKPVAHFVRVPGTCRCEHRPLAIRLAVLLASCASLAAQHRFAPVTKDYVPYLDRSLYSPLIADFDGNGTLDVLDSPSLFTNQNGQFDEWGSALTGLSYGVATHDFDGDGRPDVLHGDGNASSLQIALNRLPVGFVPGGLTVTMYGSLEAHAIADFDGDGDLDIVLFPYSTSVAARQYANDGLGNFTDVSAARMPTSHIASSGAWVLDVDRDGDQDIVLSGTTPITWLRNDGAGVLAPPITTGFPSGYYLVNGIFDADGDGDEDIVSNNGAMLVATPTGYVPMPGVFPSIFNAYEYRAADFDGDSDLDVWVEAVNGGGYFENVGNLTFVDRRNPPTYRGAVHVAITDVDGDGRLDILALTNRIEIQLGQPAGRFFDLTRLPLVGDYYADLNGDGLTDHLTVGGVPRLRRGIGAGDYVESIAWTGWMTKCHAIFDFDGDGDLDVVGSDQYHTMGLFRYDGVGSFTATFPMLGGPFSGVLSPRFVAPGDLDGDGDLDFVVHFANSALQVLMFKNQGAGVFAVDPAWTVAGLQGRVLQGVLFDADGDGDPDLVVSGNDPELYVNDGTGSMTFAPGAIPPLYPTTSRVPSKLLAGDFDGDGDADLIAPYLIPVGSSPLDATIYVNNGAGTFSVGTVFSETARWNSLDVVDVDGDADLDLVVSAEATSVGRRVEIRSNDGAGNFALASSGFDGVASIQPTQDYPTQFADVDDDGDIDVIATRSFRVVVFNQTRHLRAVNQPRLGRAFDVEFAHPEPPAVRNVAVLISTRRFFPPVTFPGVGPIVVDPAAGVLLFASGTITIPLSIPLPGNPAFLGLDLFAQAALLNGASVAISNAIHEQVIQ